MIADKTKNFFRVSAEDFKKIPGSPIAYWLNQKLFDLLNNESLSSALISGGRFKTCDDELYLKMWWEISFCNQRWHPFFKGGDGRKYWGNELRVIDWNNSAQNYYRQNGGLANSKYWKELGITWSKISTSTLSFRVKSEKYFNSASSPAVFASNNVGIYPLLSYLNSISAKYLLDMFNPTASLQVSDVLRLPAITIKQIDDLTRDTNRKIDIAHADWDSYETSRDFQENSLLSVNKSFRDTELELSALYIALRRDWQRQTEEMRRLEIENNRIFIEAYGLQDELSPEVPWNEITLTCNPWYRYGKKLEDFNMVCNDFILAKKERIAICPVNNNESDERPPASFPFAKDVEERLLEDTVKEFISYAVGCMMGRYSPEKPGLILATQGGTFLEYLRNITDNDDFQDPETPAQFNTASILATMNRVVGRDHYRPIPNKKTGRMVHPIADVDGVIPILDDEWFVDDIVAQFKDFLKLTFGAERFTENLEFVERALGKDIRKYFVRDFYKDHVQRYKKRPIYWLFSSPKGSFNALIYLHRYQPDTVSIVLNEYLREFMTKLRVQREHLITDNNRTDLAPAEKTRNMKLIDKYAAMLAELEAYERDVLFPLAQKRIAIDLDDGVKVNYVKFGDALKKIPGLEAKEE